MAGSYEHGTKSTFRRDELEQHLKKERARWSYVAGATLKRRQYFGNDYTVRTVYFMKLLVSRGGTR